ncbi:MAG: hypothetical protein ACRD0Y_04035 [Terriglobales bacterium]
MAVPENYVAGIASAPRNRLQVVAAIIALVAATVPLAFFPGNRIANL